jgi:hypothetical protein
MGYCMSGFVRIKSIICASATLAHLEINAPKAAETVSHRQSRVMEDWANHQNTTPVNTELGEIRALVCLEDYTANDCRTILQYVVSFKEFERLHRLFEQHVKCRNHDGVSCISVDGWISIRSAQKHELSYIMDPMHPFEGYAKRIYRIYRTDLFRDIEHPRYSRLIHELKSNLPPAIFAECCARTTLLKSNIGILSHEEVELYKSTLPVALQVEPSIRQELAALCREFGDELCGRTQNTCVKVRGNLTSCCLVLCQGARSCAHSLCSKLTSCCLVLCQGARSCAQSLCSKRTKVLPTNQDEDDTPVPQNLANTNLSTESPKIAANPT